jgi:hypothetical protein
MPRAVALLAALAVLAPAAGCGGGDPQRLGLAAKERPGDERQAAEVAVTYVRALANHDWAAVCATRSTKERRELERLAGSCEKGMRAAFANRAVDLFADVRPGDVRVRGDLAAVDLVQPGQRRPALTLAAVREGGRWLLEDVPDERLP